MGINDVTIKARRKTALSAKKWDRTDIFITGGKFDITIQTLCHSKILYPAGEHYYVLTFQKKLTGIGLSSHWILNTELFSRMITRVRSYENKIPHAGSRGLLLLKDVFTVTNY